MPDQQVWNYTLLSAIARGWGLAIRCRVCWVEWRWSDRELADRFAARLDDGVAELRQSLVCACGARTTILYFYMSGALDTGAGMAQELLEKEAALRRLLSSRQTQGRQ